MPTPVSTYPCILWWTMCEGSPPFNAHQRPTFIPLRTATPFRFCSDMFPPQICWTFIQVMGTIPILFSCRLSRNDIVFWNEESCHSYGIHRITDMRSFCRLRKVEDSILWAFGELGKWFICDYLWNHLYCLVICAVKDVLPKEWVSNRNRFQKSSTLLLGKDALAGIGTGITLLEMTCNRNPFHPNQCMDHHCILYLNIWYN